jgi:hypothetical protein
MITWENAIGDKAASRNPEAPIEPAGCSHLSGGLTDLTHNGTLRELSIAYCENVGDEHVWNLCPGLILNRGIETLGLGHTRITETGVGYLLQFSRTMFI